MIMETKPGYKQTEIGLIPVDWEVKPLKRVSPKQSVGLVINPSTYFNQNGTVPMLVGSNVSENSIDSTSSNKITTASNEVLSASRLNAGDIVMVRVGEPGVAAVVPPDLDQSNCASMMIIRKHASFDSHWLCCIMNSRHGRLQVEHVQYGTAQKQFNINDAVDFLYPVPPLPEQRAIATALSDVDALLDAIDRLIAKQRDLKQAAMQQLLTGETRLPGFTGKWETKRLGDLFEITSSKRVFQSEWRSEGVPFYRARELAVLGETGQVDNELFIAKSLYDSFRTAHGVPEVGDMLVTGVGTLGKVYVVRNEEEFYFKDGNIIWFKIRGAVSAEFLRQLYLTKVVMKQITDGSAGTTVGTYTISGAKKTQIPFPPLPEQTAIATVLSDMDLELAALEQRRDKTRALKQGMMQELLTGRTRLV
jgi:type I restriction enzyme S subunit